MHYLRASRAIICHIYIYIYMYSMLQWVKCNIYIYINAFHPQIVYIVCIYNAHEDVPCMYRCSCASCVTYFLRAIFIFMVIILVIILSYQLKTTKYILQYCMAYHNNDASHIISMLLVLY